MLSIGGTVRVNGEGRDIKAVAELPGETFELTWVELRDNNRVGDLGLANFKDCKNLSHLGLGRRGFSDQEAN